MGTHIKGRCIDQAYQWSRDGKYDSCTASVWTSSFSDHDPIFVEIRLGDEQNSTDNCGAFSKAKQAWSEKTFPQATAQAKQAEDSPQKTKKPGPAVTTAKSAIVTSSGFQNECKTHIQTTSRRFTNPADKLAYVNGCPGRISVRCWMNASLQLLLCGLDHKGESGWQSLQSKWGLILCQYRRHMEYTNTRVAIQNMVGNDGSERYNLGDPQKVFDNIENSDYKISDVKQIFSHRISYITAMNNCSHTVKNQLIETKVSFMLPLPPDNTDINQYLEQPLIDNVIDYTCEECKNNGLDSEGAQLHTRLKDHHQDFVLFTFNVPKGQESTVGTHRVVDHERNVKLTDSTQKMAEYQVVAIILYVNQCHFVSHVRPTSGHWMECDDSTVKILDNDGVGNHPDGRVHSILLKQIQPIPLDIVEIDARKFTNPADKLAYVNGIPARIPVRCWMNASLQLLLCGLDHKGEIGWQSLQSKWGLILKQYKRHLEYNNTRVAIEGMVGNDGSERYNLGDPQKVFDNIESIDYKISDVKSIFSHRVSITTTMNSCSHNSKRQKIQSRVSTLLSLPPENTDMNEYMEKPLVSKPKDYECEECKNKGAVSIGAQSHTKFMDHNQDFILFTFHVPKDKESNVGTHRAVDHQRNVNLIDSTGQVAEYQVIAIILYVNQNHYVTHVRRISGHWMECDDSNVKLLDSDGIGNHQNGHVHSILLKQVRP